MEKYLKVIGTENQIQYLIQLAKLRRFNAEVVNPYPICGGSNVHERMRNLKIQDKLDYEINGGALAEGCECSLCISSYIVKRTIEERAKS